MARVERILAVDIGATSIKVGEFEYPPNSSPVLTGFTYREYEEELTESSRSLVVAGLLRQMLVENDFVSRRCLLSISGQAAFTRFVKLPPVAEEEKRVRQIVEFEARQNVPFPMEEVIWDYQLIANPEAEEMDVMFVVIKNEIVEQMTGAVQAVGLEPILVDVAPAACYNAARANHVGDEECAMVLNIGGRSTNLLFADRTRFFARTIPIAGHSITQQIGKEFGIGFAEAEEIKRRHGFVALGGAYAEPESEVAAAVSKIIRNVMARLHGEINRSISVYRAHQKGNRPVALYLTGGSSTMTYTDHFFAEKLRMEVKYFNPFQVVNFGPAVDRQRLQEVAHMFSEVIGLALRYRLQCPIEVSLIPETIRRQQALRRKKPFFIASLACVLIVLFVALLANQRRATLYRGVHEVMEEYIRDLDRLKQDIEEAIASADSGQAQYDAVREFLVERQQWPDILTELNRLKPANLWLVSLTPIVGEIRAVESGRRPGMDAGAMPGGIPGGADDAGIFEDMAPGFAAAVGPGGFGAAGAGRAVSHRKEEISGFAITGHAVLVDLAAATAQPQAEAETTGAAAAGPAGAPPPPPAAAEAGADQNQTAETGAAADQETAAAKKPSTPEELYLANLRASDMFDADPKFTTIQSYDLSESVRNLSTFKMTVKLKKPLGFYQIAGWQ